MLAWKKQHVSNGCIKIYIYIYIYIYWSPDPLLTIDWLGGVNIGRGLLVCGFGACHNKDWIGLGVWSVKIGFGHAVSF